MSNEFEILVNSLFKLPRVRYAAVIDSHGEKLHGGMKPGVVSMSSTQTEKKLEIQSVLILKMAEDFETECGRLFYSSIRWEKLVGLFFLLSQDWALNVTIEGDMPLSEIFEIEKVVRRWKEKNKLVR